MNSPAVTTSPADEINRLHAEAMKLAAASRQSLDAALMAAWRAGALLIAEKQSVRRMMGAGAWLIWLENNFRGTPRTAQRYMRLARSVADRRGDVALDPPGAAHSRPPDRVGAALPPQQTGRLRGGFFRSTRHR